MSLVFLRTIECGTTVNASEGGVAFLIVIVELRLLDDVLTAWLTGQRVCQLGARDKLTHHHIYRGEERSARKKGYVKYGLTETIPLPMDGYQLEKSSSSQRSHWQRLNLTTSVAKKKSRPWQHVPYTWPYSNLIWTRTTI